MECGCAPYTKSATDGGPRRARSEAGAAGSAPTGGRAGRRARDRSGEQPVRPSAGRSKTDRILALCTRRRPKSHARTRRSESGRTRAPDAAGEELAKLPLDEPRQSVTVAACSRLGEEGLEVPAQGPVQHAVLRSPGHVRPGRTAIVPAGPGTNRVAGASTWGRHVRGPCHQGSIRRNGSCLSCSDRYCPGPGAACRIWASEASATPLVSRPEDRNSVGPKAGIARDDGEPFRCSLRDEDSVEGIAVMHGQVAN